MTLNDKIYQQVRQLLYERYAYPIEQIQPQIYYQIELAIDSLEMFEIMAQFEETFDISISLDDIDDFMFQPQDINYRSDIKKISIQDSVDYIEKQIKIRNQLKNNLLE